MFDDKNIVHRTRSGRCGGLDVRAPNDTVLDIVSGICDDMISFYNFFMAD